MSLLPHDIVQPIEEAHVPRPVEMNTPQYGTVQATGGIYIPRPADSLLFENCRQGKFSYVLAARQMGKSSLMIRTVEKLSEEGVYSVIVDLTLMGTLLSAEQWYLGVIDLVTTQLSQLPIEEDYKEWWDKHSYLGVTQRLTQYFRECLLERIDESVVIFVDEIDTTLSLDFTDDFFAAIRAMYNARSENPIYRRLSFVLMGVATPSELIRDPKRTPFNVGERIDMTYFTKSSAVPLVDGWDIDRGKATQILEWVFDWTSGHPYLTQKLCNTVSREPDKHVIDEFYVARTTKSIFFSGREWQDNNLRSVRDMLLERIPKKRVALTTYKEIAFGADPFPDVEKAVVLNYLKLSGIVRRNEIGNLIISNRVYERVFDLNWLRENTYPLWIQKQGRFISDKLKQAGHTYNVAGQQFVSIKKYALIFILFLLANWVFRLIWPTLASLYQITRIFLNNVWNSVLDVSVQPMFSLLTFVLALISVLLLLVTTWRGRFGRHRNREINDPQRDKITRRTIYGRAMARASLIVLEGDVGIGKSIDIYGTTTIGRSIQDAELLFHHRDTSSPISRRHCSIIDEEDHFLIRDEDSANGTYLNGVLLDSMVPRELTNGDEIELAKVEWGGVKLHFSSALGIATQETDFIDRTVLSRGSDYDTKNIVVPRTQHSENRF